LELNPGLLSVIRRRLELAERISVLDQAFSEIAFSDDSIVFLNGLPEDLEEQLWSDGDRDWTGTDAYPKEFAARTELDAMVVMRCGDIYFRATPKHGDITVETHSLNIKALEAMLAVKSIEEDETGEVPG
jgi:hypothetical protein